MSSDDSLEVKLGASEVGIKLGSGFLAKLMPTRTLNSDVRKFFTTRLLSHVQDGNLEEHDMLYAAAVLQPQEAELVNRMWIAKRTVVLLEERKSQALLAPHDSDSVRTDEQKEEQKGEQKEGKPASEDWLLKFWSDAGVVSDANVRELYARILAGEVNDPGSFSMRALKVLRYLDSRSAQVFGKILPWIFNGMYLPSNEKILSKIPLDFNDLLELEDAELIVSHNPMSITPPPPKTILRMGDRVLQVKHNARISIPVKILSRAGQDLCSVAEVLRDTSYFFEVARWIAAGETEVTWAEIPSDARGPVQIDSLQWLPVPTY